VAQRLSARRRANRLPLALAGERALSWPVDFDARRRPESGNTLREATRLQIRQAMTGMSSLWQLGTWVIDRFQMSRPGDLAPSRAPA
jgi:hypothetical protein